MEPIGLTFKHEGFGKVGEIMFIHLCLSCSKIHINRVARDDPEHGILVIFEKSLGLTEGLRKRLSELGIYLLEEQDKEEVNVQLFGNQHF
jgi:hypothetical protein